MQETEFSPYNQIVYASNQNPSKKMRHKILRNFKLQTNHLIPARKPDLVPVDKKQKTNHLVDYREKIKEHEKIDEYADFAGELRNLWNMKMMVIPIVVGALGMIPKGL